MKGRPRFFCEHCGKEVSRSDEKCPSCGRFFASVRCPKCGFVGSQNLFSSGCPVCGYSAPRTPDGIGEDGPDGSPSKRAAIPAGALPAWVYLITILALAAAVAAAFFVLR